MMTSRRDALSGIGIAVLAVLVIGVGGCGGSDNAGGETPIVTTVAKAPKKTARKPQARPAKKERARPPAAQPKHREDEATDDQQQASKPLTARQLLRLLRRKHLPTAQFLQQFLTRVPFRYRARVVRRFGRVALKALDLKHATLKVPAGGERVEVTLSPATACRAHPDEDERILRALTDAISPKAQLPYPSTVTVAVRGTQQPLATYLATQCKPLTLPGAPGRIVFTQRGSNVDTTRPFEITAKRWTVEFATHGSFFQALVYKGKKLQGGPIVAKGGSGGRTFAGPGRFKLSIAGTSEWIVRVRQR